MSKAGTKWPEKSLAELCSSPDDIKCGPFGTQLNKSEFREEGVPLWGIKHVNKYFSIPTDEFLDPGTAHRLSQYDLIFGDLVMTRKGTVGNCAVYPSEFPPGIMHSDLLRLRLDLTRCDPGYFLHQLHHSSDVARQLALISGGAIMPGINVGKLKSIKVVVPPLPEQRRIAQILDKAEALRAKRRAALAKLDTLAQSIFLEMFGDPATNPLGFVVSSLDDVCDVRDGTHDSPKYVQNNGYPLVTSRNISGGIVDLSGANLISESDYQQINKRSKVDIGDILMPMIGTIGSPVIVLSEPKFAIKNIALIKFGSNSLANSTFIHALLSSSYFDRIIETNNRGGTQKFLSLGDIRSIKTPLPPLPLQQAFARRVEAIEALKERHRASLAKLDALFASLQDRAFKGEL